MQLESEICNPISTYININSLASVSEIHSLLSSKVLYMSFDKFLLAVESLDLSQADKSIIRVSSFPKLFLNDEIYSYTKKNYLALGNLAKLMFWSFKNLQD